MTAASGLDEQEVERLVREAQEHGQADRDRHDLVDLRNKLDGLVYSSERTLDEFAENISDDDRQELLAAIAAAKEQMAGEDAEALRPAVDELSALTYKMTEQLYAELGGDDD